jgi:hypothetical protein
MDTAAARMPSVKAAVNRVGAEAMKAFDRRLTIAPEQIREIEQPARELNPRPKSM